MNGRTLLLLLLFLPVLALAESVRIQVIDRGQADGILIRTPIEKKWIVIDAGTNKQQADAMADSWGVDKLELAIATHRHRDHIGGLDEVLEGIDTERFIGLTEPCDTQTMRDLLEALDTRAIPIAELSSTPVVYDIDGIKLTVLPIPTPHASCEHENMNSIVVRLDYGEFSMLFAGDTEDESLDWLVEHYPDLLDVDVLKASHHGSNNGYTDAFLEAVSPDSVVISAGVHGTYKHPMEQAVNAYLSATNNQVYCTNRQGTIRVYGYRGGSAIIRELIESDKSCVYDGTHY